MHKQRNMNKTLIHVLEVKKLRQDEVISKVEYHNELVDTFAKTLDFKFSEKIGRGSFSTVLSVWNENDERAFAMKIVLKEDIGPKETEWRQLHHENILPLLDTESFPVFDLTWFLSPVVELTLEDVLQKKMFQKYFMGSKLAVSWMKQITSSLNYMHEKELSFLNLKLNNVMICDDNKIKLFGFHHLSKIGEFTKGYDVPNVFKPPESYSSDGRKLPVEGKSFDIWCLGILCIEVFTDKYLTRKMPDEECCWSDIVYPQMFKILKKNKFNKECRCAFPNCKMEKKTLKLIRNFSKACLRISVESRPSTATLLNHRLFEGTGLLAEKDKVWRKQLKMKTMTQKIKDINLIFESIETTTSNVDIQTDSQYTRSVDKDNDDADHNNEEIVVLESEGKNVLDEQALPKNAENFQKDNETFPYQLIDNDDADHINGENVVLEREGKEVLVEQVLPNNAEIFQEDIDIFPYQLSPSVNFESSDNLSFLQGMFGRIVIEHCQENLTCRVLHRDIIVKTMRNFVECKRNDESEKVSSENVNDIKSMQSAYVECKGQDKTKAICFENVDDMETLPSSSRMNSLGYKIASKMFQFFI